ncbi:MAG: hypothetical protein LUG61_06255 [Lachnospiraceae bacterium]|nr:hypothetical protein [Lachnospiraceae bacterium]
MLTVFEFPWRWLSYATLFGVLCTAATVDSEEIRHLFGAVPVPLLLSAVLIFNTGQIYSDQLYTSDVTVYQNVYYLDFAYSPEFVPNGTELSGLYYTNLLYEEEQLSAGDYHYEKNHWQFHADNTSSQTAAVDIPVLCYNNYVAYDADSGENLEISSGENNRIRVHIPAGYTGTVVVKYQLPSLWKLAIAVSVATDLALAGYAVYFRKRKSAPKPESSGE